MNPTPTPPTEKCCKESYERGIAVENEAWMMGRRCEECGGDTTRDLSNMCATCFEEA